MSHLYPLATDASDALSSETDGARTREQARSRLSGRKLVGLKSDWLTLSSSEAEARAGAIERGVDLGFVQRYEDASGNTVLAITFWAVTNDAPDTPEAPEPAPEKPKPGNDHTDDLYFRSGRTKKRGPRRPVDPNQLDLFGATDNTKIESEDRADRRDPRR